MIKNIFFLVFSFWLTLSFSQNEYKKGSDEFIIAQIALKIPDVKSLVESKIMNPFTKELYSRFAIDTFRIAYYLEQKSLYSLLSYKERIELVKDATKEYESIMNKYFELSKKEATENQKKALIISQENWEVFRQKEFTWLSTRLKEEILDVNYYRQYCNIVKERMSTMFYYYTDFVENGN
ncbi:hypothetical protein [Flavobacterium sp. LHD-85]|uniref:hypothetical protein n=1 Tax=Flavobacterium sp. LHD-85 TaxID=3071410 RepID=UPI0027E1D53E|nr:hypothetical protein [Flavobacterium sp. LHD-85]MDQ6531709.1 hypothetical protein [Flavobacterium sp. LHD-85]